MEKEEKYLKAYLSYLGLWKTAFKFCTNIHRSFYICSQSIDAFSDLSHYCLTFTALWANTADDKLMIFFHFFPQKIGSDLSCKLSPKVTKYMVKAYFLGTIEGQRKVKTYFLGTISKIFQNVC